MVVNFGPLAAENGPVVWAPQLISTGFTSWQRYCTALQYWASAKLCGIEQRHHLYSAGRPSHWASTHILVFTVLSITVPCQHAVLLHGDITFSSCPHKMAYPLIWCIHLISFVSAPFSHFLHIFLLILLKVVFDCTISVSCKLYCCLYDYLSIICWISSKIFTVTGIDTPHFCQCILSTSDILKELVSCSAMLHWCRWLLCSAMVSTVSVLSSKAE